MISRSPFPDVEIPTLTLPEFIFQTAPMDDNKPVLIDGRSGREVSRSELAMLVRRCAVGLAGYGFSKGDVFAIVTPNVLEFAIAFYAVASLGGATTMINPLYRADEMEYQFRDSGAGFVLTLPEYLDVVVDAASKTGAETIFVLGATPGAISFDTLLEQDGTLPDVDIDPKSDVVALPYSSGTTGRAKGVMLTHRNIIANAFLQRIGEGVSGDDVSVAVFPFFHIGGLSWLNVSLHAGATLVLMRRYELRTLLQFMQDYRATRVTLPPPVVLDLSRHPAVDEFDLSCLRHVQWGAAPLSETVERACRERLGCAVKQGYALSEASSRTHTIPGNCDSRPGSAGPPLPGIECKIADPATGAALQAGETGEICIRGPIVMKGYLNRPDATSQVVDSDGWLHTGDIGVCDSDGWLHIVDRMKELIKYNAYQVAPAELEAVLISHPAVADVAVIPSPDDRAGEVPKAFVVLKEDRVVSEEELIEFVSSRVAHYKKVRLIEFIDHIPKSASGKILRRVLVEKERAKRPLPSSGS